MEQLIALTGVKLHEDEQTKLIQALEQYGHDCAVRAKKRQDDLLAHFLLTASQDGQQSAAYRQAAQKALFRGTPPAKIVPSPGTGGQE